MKTILFASVLQLVLLISGTLSPAKAFADPLLSYDCTGTAPFSGTVTLAEDAQSQVPGVDHTYFGFASRQHPNSGGLAALVMFLVGRKDAEPGVNRICFAWALGRKQGPSASSSISGGDDCSGFTSKNGAVMTIVGNGGSNSFVSCNFKIAN